MGSFPDLGCLEQGPLCYTGSVVTTCVQGYQPWVRSTRTIHTGNALQPETETKSLYSWAWSSYLQAGKVKINRDLNKTHLDEKSAQCPKPWNAQPLQGESNCPVSAKGAKASGHLLCKSAWEAVAQTARDPGAHRIDVLRPPLPLRWKSRRAIQGWARDRPPHQMLTNEPPNQSASSVPPGRRTPGLFWTPLACCWWDRETYLQSPGSPPCHALRRNSWTVVFDILKAGFLQLPSEDQTRGCNLSLSFSLYHEHLLVDSGFTLPFTDLYFPVTSH